MRSRSMGTRGGRGRSAAVLALGLLLLSAAPAAAGVPPVPGPVQDVVDTVNDVASSNDPIGDAVDAVDDVAGDVTGTEDPIQDTVDTVDDVAGDVTGTEDPIQDTVDQVGDTAGEVVDRVDDATGGTIGDIVGDGQTAPDRGSLGGPGPRGNPHGRSLSPDGHVFGAARRNARRGEAIDRARPDRTTSPASTGGGAAASSESDTPRAETGLGERLREAAIDASKKLAVPLALTLVVLCYLLAQYWADRKDPKLLLAPVDADHDLLSFR